MAHPIVHYERRWHIQDSYQAESLDDAWLFVWGLTEMDKGDAQSIVCGDALLYARLKDGTWRAIDRMAPPVPVRPW